MKIPSQSVLWLIACALPFVRAVYVALLPAEDLVQYVPDDSFYYLEMAQNWLATGRWTFDGVEPATGFHPLFALLVAAVIKLQGGAYDWRATLGVIALVNVSLLTASAVMTWSVAKGLRRWSGIGAVAIFLSPLVIIQSNFAIEGALVIFFASLTVWGYAAHAESKRSFPLGVVFVAAFMGSLARSDFGLLPGVLFLAHFAVRGRTQDLRSLLAGSLPLLGAICGVLAVLVHTRHISGELTQSSAEMKLYWSSLRGHSSIPTLTLLASTLLPLVYALPEFIQQMTPWSMACLVLHVGACVVLGLRLWAGFARRRELSAASAQDALSPNGERDVVRQVFLVTAVGSLVGYLVFYKFNSAALQPWYSANLLIPSSLLLFVAFDQPFLASSATKSSLVLVYVTASLATFMPIWPHQRGMYLSALALRDHRLDGSQIASWNAGIIGHLSERHVINIDGLVNDRVHDFVVSDHLVDYMQLREVDYVADYAVMLTHAERVERSGLRREEIRACLTPERALDHDARPWRRTHLTLYRFRCP